jgi:hypothetical protein
VTSIEEAKDLNILSAEDLISSLKCHEICLNEQEHVRKPKSIALNSKGKSSKALKANESEDESPIGGPEEDLEEEIDMLSNRLQWLSRGSGYKGSRKEDQKGCFNCKKHGHFIADCPDLQKEKSKKANFKSNKFRRQIKQSLMATWEDLDNE